MTGPSSGALLEKKAFAVSFLVCFLAISGVAAVFYFLATGGANENFASYPFVVNLHVIPGAVYLLLAPLQFSKSLRSKSINTHRWMGRVLTLFAIIAGFSALFVGLVIPYSGVAEQIIIGIFGSFFVFSLAAGFIQVRRKNIASHREWMIRALALGLSIATMRFFFVPSLIMLSPSREETEFLSIASFTLAFLIHCSFAEYWIRKTRAESISQK